MLAIVMIASPVARGEQPVTETQPRPVNADMDASGLGADQAEQARMQAEYARLKTEHDELEARLASLEGESARERRSRPGPWATSGLYGLALVLSILWAWRWKGARRS